MEGTKSIRYIILSAVMIVLSGCYNGANFDMLIKNNLYIGAPKEKAVEAFTSSGFTCNRSQHPQDKNRISCDRDISYWLPPGNCNEYVIFGYDERNNNIIKIDGIFRHFTP